MFRQSRPTPSYSDTVRPGPTALRPAEPNAALLTLDVVSQQFITAGLPRSMRTLQRYCANGTLHCVKEATDTGDTYFVAETSVAPAITALRQLHEAKKSDRHGATEPAVSMDVIPENEPFRDSDHVGPGPSEPDDDAQLNKKHTMATSPDTSAYVTQLEERLEEKDEEISFLREELIDRRGQIKDMKGIIDGQNQLLEVIQRNVAPIFKSLASTVEQGKVSLRRHDQTPEPHVPTQPEPSDTRGLL